MNYTVVIVAAGVGKRMQAGINKQLLEVAGKPLVAHTLSAFARDQRCAQVVLVAHDRDRQVMKTLGAQYAAGKNTVVASGGATRQESVYAGLEACDRQGVVLIHDGARPFIDLDGIHRLVACAADSGAVIPALPVTDTVKRVADGRIRETLQRESLWAAQTPQAFRLPLARDIHEKARREGFSGTDDAALAEHFGYDVRVIEGDAQNIKITTPHDLTEAERILAAREG